MHNLSADARSHCRSLYILKSVRLISIVCRQLLLLVELRYAY